MKIFYITPVGKRKDYLGDGKEFNLTEISSSIIEGIKEEFQKAEIILPRDLTTENGYIPEEKLNGFDIYICDMTTSNPSVCFAVGIVEGMGKPIIYFTSNESGIIAAASHKNHLQYSDASLKNEFRSELNDRIAEAIKNPDKFKSASITPTTKQKAFISYSHKDKTYLNRLMIHLKPLKKKGLLDVWEDSQIKTGDKWEEKINKALNEANIAILLISADFMASDFITDNELPPILSKVEVSGTKILPLIISPCRFSREQSLKRFQAANFPDNPLSSMSENEREIVYDKVSKEIESALTNA